MIYIVDCVDLVVDYFGNVWVVFGIYVNWLFYWFVVVEGLIWWKGLKWVGESFGGVGIVWVVYLGDCVSFIVEFFLIVDVVDGYFYSLLLGELKFVIWFVVIDGDCFFYYWDLNNFLVYLFVVSFFDWVVWSGEINGVINEGFVVGIWFYCLVVYFDFVGVCEFGELVLVYFGGERGFCCIEVGYIGIVVIGGEVNSENV